MTWGAVVKGVEVTKKGLGIVGENATQGMRRGARRWLEETAAASSQLVPRLTGHLARSVRVEMQDTIGGVKGSISYNAPYAAIVHEIPRPPSSNGQWKYLEQPFMERLPELTNTVAAEVKRGAR